MKRARLRSHESRQPRPAQPTGPGAVVALLRTTDVVRRHLAGIVEAHGLTLQQFNVLRILRGAGDDGLPTLQVAERMIEQTPGVTRLLDRLEKKTLVRRQRCRKDRRQHLCWITQKGRTLLDQLDGPALRASEECLGGLNRTEQAALVRLLEAVRPG